MIRTHVIGQKESISGDVLDHMYSFYVHDDMDEIRIVEMYLDNGKILNNPNLYREFITMADPKTHMPVSIYVDGKHYTPRHHARSLYKMLLGMGYIPYTS